MSARDPIPFRFEKHDIRVVHIDGEPHFAGKDVCDALGYADHTNAMKQHCKGVVKRHPLWTTGGIQELRVLAESDVLRLIVNSALPSAEAFEHWVFEEVLPSIRKTGTYSMPTAPAKPPNRAAQSLLSDAKAIDFIGNMVAKVPGARADVVAAIKLRMIEERTGLPATQFGGALPAESLVIAVKLNPTEIGRRLTPKLSPIRVNALLIGLGLQRKSESGYVLTEAGAAHGEVHPFQAKNKHVGDQIDWYESVVEAVREAMQRPPPSTQGKLGIE